MILEMKMFIRFNVENIFLTKKFLYIKQLLDIDEV